MTNPTTISQVCHEVEYFQEAIYNYDWVLTYAYLSMLFDDVNFDDKDFVFAIIDDWELNAMDFLTAAMADNPKFIMFMVLEKDDVLEIIDNLRNAIMKQGIAMGL